MWLGLRRVPVSPRLASHFNVNSLKVNKASWIFEQKKTVNVFRDLKKKSLDGLAIRSPFTKKWFLSLYLENYDGLEGDTAASLRCLSFNGKTSDCSVDSCVCGGAAGLCEFLACRTIEDRSYSCSWNEDSFLVSITLPAKPHEPH